MQKQIIDVPAQEENNQQAAHHRPMSQELQLAIQNLISKLREREQD